MKLKKHRKWKRIDRWLQTAIISMSIMIVGTWVYSQTITILTIGRLQLGNNTVMTGGQFQVPNGSAASPSISFSSDPTMGFWSEGANIIDISFGGVRSIAFTTGQLYLLNNTSQIWWGVSPDLSLRRDAPNTLAQVNFNFDQTQRWYGANNSYFQIATQSELLTILSAAFTDTAMSIPANAIVRGVAVYVVTVIPTAATFTVTGATSTTVFNTAAVGTGAGSNDVGDQNTPYKNGAAQLIRITPNLVPLAATGQVRIVLMYEIPSAPTS